MLLTKCQLIVKELGAHVLEHGLSDSFRDLAREKQSGLVLSDIDELTSMLVDPPEESSNYDIKKHGLGGWLSACQFSIFELLYNFKGDALPFIRDIAWGEYDWTQANAIELLIRLAAEGIERERIISEIKLKFPNIRYEAQLYSIEPLIALLDSSPKIRNIINELMDIQDLREVFEELSKDDILHD